jgi:pectate lyase
VCSAGACTTSTCPFGYVFCDDFEDGVADGWTTSGGTWSVLLDSGNHVYEGGGSQESWAGSTTWTDQTVEAQVKVVTFGGTSDSYRAGIMARRSGASAFYALQILPSGNVGIRRSTSLLSGCADVPSGVTPTNWFTLKLQVSGAPASVTLKGFVNGALKLSCTQTSGYGSGQIGFVTYGTGTVARFDNVKVSTP